MTPRSVSFALAAATALAPAAPAAAQNPPAAPAAATAGANRWNVDPVHSGVNFRVRHLGISWVNGAFRQWTAELIYDANNPEASSVTARIQTASLDTQNERRDGDIKSANYLAVDSFPEITFTSRRVERVGPARLRITGDLTIHGTTRSAVLDTEIGGIVTTARGRRVAFTATTTITRQDFGITLNQLMEGAQIVGDAVRITIDIEATAPPASP